MDDDSATAGLTLLVVDDDPASREVLALLLREEGFRVVVAASPKEALFRIDRPGTKIDMLLTDIHLPGMSGVDLAERVRSKNGDVRVAFISGDLRPPANALGLFIQKPFDLDVLVEVVKRELLPGCATS